MSRTHLLLRNIFADLKSAKTPDDIMRQIKLLEVKFPKLHGTSYLRLSNLMDKGIMSLPNHSVDEKYTDVKVGDLSDVGNKTTIKALTEKGLNENSLNHFYNKDQILDSEKDVQEIGRIIVAGIKTHPIITDKKQLIEFLRRTLDQTHGLLDINSISNTQDRYDELIDESKNQDTFVEVITKFNGVTEETHDAYVDKVDYLGIGSTFTDREDISSIVDDAEDEDELVKILRHYAGERGDIHMIKYDTDLKKFVFADSKENDRKLIDALIDNLNYDPDNDEDCDEDDEDQCCDYDDCDNEDCDDSCED